MIQRISIALLIALAAAGCSSSAAVPAITDARPNVLSASAVAIAADRGTTTQTVELLGRDLVPAEHGAYNFDASSVKVQMKRDDEKNWKTASIVVWRPDQLTVQFGSQPWTASPGTLLFRVVHTRLLFSRVYSNPFSIPVTTSASSRPTST